MDRRLTAADPSAVHDQPYNWYRHQTHQLGPTEGTTDAPEAGG